VGIMDIFSFIIHPLTLEDFYRKFTWVRKFPKSLVKKVNRYIPPFKLSKITGIKSKTGKEIEGYFFTCPLTSEQIINSDQKFVLQKIIDTVQKAKKKGSNIVGLGSFTSVVGDKGITISKNVDIPVTTGNSYTVATALEGSKLAVQKMGMDLKNEVITVIGANGSIGKTVSRLIAKESFRLNLVSRNINKLKQLSELIKNENKNIEIMYTDQIQKALQESKIIISASGAVKSLIDPANLLSGAVVCDVARPRDVARNIENQRKDILVIEGGLVRIPGSVNFNFDFGIGNQNAYACMAETMLLTLEEKYVNYSLGPNIQIEKVKETMEMAEKHGFQLAGLRSSGELLTDEKIKQIRKNANN